MSIRKVFSAFLVGAAMLALNPYHLMLAGNALFTEKGLDRTALVALMEQYLTSLAKHDPSAVPLASDVKLVENTELTSIGKGLWETATGGPTEFKIFVADPIAGQVGFIELSGKIINRPL